MPIRTQWWSFVESVVSIDQNAPGVYELGNENGTVVYIGSSDDLKRRLTEHLNEEPFTCIRQNATRYRIEYTAEYENWERELHRVHIAAFGKAPKCNNSIRQ